MKIVFVSDTHNKHHQFEIPEGDVLIHCGDYSMLGSEHETDAFADWISKLQHKQVFICPGNHDQLCQKNEAKARALIEGARENVKLLIHEPFELNGLKGFASPYTPRYGFWSFMEDRGEAIRRLWAQIPDDTELLITHGPPHGILDLVPGEGVFDEMSAGCEELRARVEQLAKLKCHAFGHLHRQGGQIRAHNGVQFVNAAMLDDYYREPRRAAVVKI